MFLQFGASKVQNKLTKLILKILILTLLSQEIYLAGFICSNNSSTSNAIATPPTGYCCINNDNNGGCPSNQVCLLGTCQTATPSAAPQQIFNTYQKLNKALYVWNAAPGGAGWQALLQNTNKTADTLIEFCIKHGFTRIYLYIGATQYNWTQSYANKTLPFEAGIAYIIQKAVAQNIQVYALYYLNDDPDDIYLNSGNPGNCPSSQAYQPDDITKVTDLVNSVIAYNGRNPKAKFTGIMGDQEPDNSNSYCNYLTINQIIQNVIKASVEPTLQTAVSLKPVWVFAPAAYTYQNKLYNQPLFQSILPLINLPSLLTYSSSPFVSQTGDFKTAGCKFSTTVYLYADPLITYLFPPKTAPTQNISPTLKAQLQTPEITVETGAACIPPASCDYPCISYGDTINPNPTQPTNTDLSPGAIKFYTYLTNIYANYNTPTPTESPSATIAVHDFSQYFKALYNYTPLDCPGAGASCTFKPSS